MEVGIILAYFSLFNPYLYRFRSGGSEVTLSYVSTYFLTFSPYRAAR